jgi:hypothetical protein
MTIKWTAAILSVCICFAVATGVRAQYTTNGKLSVHVQNVFNGAPLMLNDRAYGLTAGDSIFISAYKFYVSNIRLVNAEGKEVEEPESYHLVNEARSSSKTFDIDVPEGRYISMRFMIGVDSLHNVSGAQTDALDPVNAMFWDWNTGYIMAKLEGRRNDPEQTEFSFHIGGFAGANNTLRWVTLRFATPITIKASLSTEMVLKTDVAEWFKTPNMIYLDKTPVVTMEGADAVRIADNYADMFSLSHVE